ncbi:LPS export ABC transporter periplasmic protein LptC [Marinobacterium weihaiense]|uniref:LPS export ABC transporter periplasmic protein LptC n=1 Tax=Marinobacterium weihaiense TaxID=2851016 RepID=A0ABS6MB49_9GAMM|nr:LPS export ABC transporter periplasmic protein LptC [Marinobacterium weihaiense]MBV0933071.1 LPS export ABC transporter periplasmic protein LptC [Marinobacterium weihaiense]
MLSQRQRLLTAAVLISAPLLWWGLHTPQETLPSATAPRVEAVDFFVRGAEITRWQDDGRTGQIMTTPLMRHFPAREQMELTMPLTRVPGADGGEYRIQAECGILPDSQNEVLLAGGVQLHDNPASGLPARLHTDTLTLYPPRDFAHTDAQVMVERGSDSTSATGMDVFFDQQRIDLLSGVKGEYHVQ